MSIYRVVSRAFTVLSMATLDLGRPAPLINMVYYSIFIEGGIFVSHGIWLIRTRKLRKEAKLAGKSFDDLPESEDYHVNVARRGSIAAARDIQKDQIERRGSVALARDLEKGPEVIQEPVDNEQSDSVVKPSKASTLQLSEEEVGSGGVDIFYYGTMPRNVAPGSRTRPGYARQELNLVTLNKLTHPNWYVYAE